MGAEPGRAAAKERPREAQAAETQGEPDGRSFWQTVAAKPAAFFLILLMAIGSVFLWLGIPVGWIWGVSQAVDSSEPQLGPYLVILAGIPITMFVVGKVLFKLNDVYARVTGQPSEVQVQLAWLRSMRGERTPARRTSVLDVVMVISVGIAVVVFAIWFFFFAGSSLPNA